MKIKCYLAGVACCIALSFAQNASAANISAHRDCDSLALTCVALSFQATLICLDATQPPESCTEAQAAVLACIASVQACDALNCLEDKYCKVRKQLPWPIRDMLPEIPENDHPIRFLPITPMNE